MKSTGQTPQPMTPAEHLSTARQMATQADELMSQVKVDSLGFRYGFNFAGQTGVGDKALLYASTLYAGASAHAALAQAESTVSAASFAPRS